MTALEAIEGTFRLGGVLFVAAALVFALLEPGVPSDGSALRRWLIGGWQALQAARWADVPDRTAERLVAFFRRLIGAFFVDADRTSFFNGVFAGLVFVLVPGAALVNAVSGGRPFLILYYLTLLGALALLNFAGEARRRSWLAAAAAVYLGVSLVVVVPAYVLHSFTEVTIHNVFSHAVMKSFLVAIFWYMAAYALKLVADVWFSRRGIEVEATAGGRFFHDFLAGVPVAYALTFLALLVSHLAELDSMPQRSWGLILASVLSSSASFATAMWLVGRAQNGQRMTALALAAVLGAFFAAALFYFSSASGWGPPTWVEVIRVLAGVAPGGGRTHLSHDFWVMHLPFLPVLTFAGAILLAGFAKAAAGVLARLSAGDRILQERPFFAAAAFCAWMSALAFGITGAV